MYCFTTAMGASKEEFRTVSKIYYYTDNDEKIAKQEMEISENDQFRYSRDPAAIAKDLAADELAQGNVCLMQAEEDMQKILKKEKEDIQDLCQLFFRYEVDKKERSAVLKRGLPVCAVNIEAHESNNMLELYLVFRYGHPSEKDPRQMRRIASIGGAISKENEEQSWPRYEVLMGKKAKTWRGLLKNGACTINDDTLELVYDNYVEQLKDRKNLVKCNRYQKNKTTEFLSLQTQMNRYIPRTWFKELKSEEANELLKIQPQVEPYKTLAECKSGIAETEERLKKLVKVSEKIADKHDITALDFENYHKGRKLSSEF